MIEINLTPEEIEEARDVARRRQAGARGLANVYGATGCSEIEAFTKHFMGACGEIAVRRVWGLDCPLTVDTFGNGGDVGGLQVRTRRRHHWDLIIREADVAKHYDDPYVLVTMEKVGECRVHGFITPADGAKVEYWQDHGGWGGAFFVPQCALKQISGELHAVHNEDPGA